MNRHERRAQGKAGDADLKAGASGAVVAPNLQRPSLGLRIFARLLLAKWVIKRVHHPDLIAILMQIAQQVGRTDAIAQLALKSYSPPR